MPWKDFGLGPRLAILAEFIESQARLIDVATDHAKLPAALLRSGKLSYAIASDIAEKPLRAARQLHRVLLEEGKLLLRQGDGLAVLGQEPVNTLSIAGVGDLTMVRILEQLPKYPQLQTVVLQPNSAPDLVRRALRLVDFEIDRELLTVEGQRCFISLRAVYRKGISQRALSREEEVLGSFTHQGVQAQRFRAWIEAQLQHHQKQPLAIQDQERVRILEAALDRYRKLS